MHAGPPKGDSVHKFTAAQLVLTLSGARLYDQNLPPFYHRLWGRARIEDDFYRRISSVLLLLALRVC